MLTRYKFFIIGLLVSLALWLTAVVSTVLPAQAQTADSSTTSSTVEAAAPTQATAEVAPPNVIN